MGAEMEEIEGGGIWIGGVRFRFWESGFGFGFRFKFRRVKD